MAIEDIQKFCQWIATRHDGEKVSPAAADRWLAAYIAELRAQHERRKDYLSRILVAGFSHMLVNTGEAAAPGALSRNLVPFFVSKFSQVAHDVVGDELVGYQQRAQALLGHTVVSDATDANMWRLLRTTNDTAPHFRDLIADFLCMFLSSGGADSLRASVDIAKVDGLLVDPDDIDFVITDWVYSAMEMLDRDDPRLSTLQACLSLEVPEGVVADYQALHGSSASSFETDE